MQRDYEAFARELQASGYAEVVVRTWPPFEVVDTHRHPFAARALVVAGEMWLTARRETRHLKPGDEFHLDAGEPHAERYGEDGATYWVGRRSDP